MITIKKPDGSIAPLESLVSGVHPATIPLDKIGGVQRLTLAPGNTPEIVRLSHHLTLHQAGKLKLTSAYDNTRSVLSVVPGNLHFRPALAPHASEWDNNCEITVVALNSGFVQTCAFDLFRQDLTTVSFRPLLAGNDPLAWELASRLEAIAFDQAQSDSVYLEQIAVALAMHLIVMRGNLAPRPDVTRASLDKVRFRRVNDFVEDNLGEPLALGELASLAGLSKYHFCRQFKKLIGVSPGQWIQTKRMQRARALLSESTLTITEIGVLVGYSNLSHFSRAFTAHYKTSPAKFRRHVNNSRRKKQ